MIIFFFCYNIQKEVGIKAYVLATLCKIFFFLSIHQIYWPAPRDRVEMCRLAGKNANVSAQNLSTSLCAVLYT